MSTAPRPTPTQWLGYAVLGRPLPAELHGWVLRDITGPWARVRHVVRGEMVYVPVFVVFLLFPGPLWVRGLMVLMGLLLSTFYTVAFMDQNRARRLERHGLPPDPSSEHDQQVHDAERAEYERVYRS